MWWWIILVYLGPLDPSAGTLKLFGRLGVWCQTAKLYLSLRLIGKPLWRLSGIYLSVVGFKASMNLNPAAFWILVVTNLVASTMKPKFDCLGLSKEWECLEELRERIRSEKKVLTYPIDQKFCEANRPNATRNAVMLTPMLKRLSNTQKWKLPHVPDLEIEVRTLYEKTGLVVSPESKLAYKTSVELKRLCGLVSRKTKRNEVTKDRYGK